MYRIIRHEILEDNNVFGWKDEETVSDEGESTVEIPQLTPNAEVAINNYSQEEYNRKLNSTPFMKARNARQKRIMKEVSRYSSQVTGLIYKLLSEKGIRFSNVQDAEWMKGFKPDIALYVPKSPILEWWFDIRTLLKMPVVNDESRYRYYTVYLNINNLIGRFMYVEPRADRKISLVINNDDAFDRIMEYKDKLPYRGDFSVILIDEDNNSVVCEEYIAHYMEDDTSSEFYIK